MAVYTVECALDELHWELGNRIRERMHRGEQVQGCWKTSYRGGRDSGVIRAYVITDWQVILGTIWPYRSWAYDPRYNSSAITMLFRDMVNIAEEKQGARVSRLILKGAKGNSLSMEFGAGPSFEHFKRTLEAVRAGGLHLKPPEPLPAPPVSSPDVTKPDIGSQLIQLAELFKQGILTDEEFQLAKKKILEGQKD